MMTYSQPSSYYYDHSPAFTKPSAGKTQLAENRYYGSPSSSNSHGSYSTAGSIANPRTLPPYISVQRASEPASPATVATTISSHSTPSPSPSRNMNLQNGAPNADFTLFDDAIIAAAHDMNSNSGKGRTGIDVSSSITDSSTLPQYATSGFPIIVPHDASYSNYTPSGLYGSYSSNFPVSQHDQQSSKYLRPSTSSYREVINGSNMPSSPLIQSTSQDVEAVENVPALSPTSRQRNSTSTTPRKAYHAGTRSPHHDSVIRPTHFPSASSTYLHSAMPKLGRTFSDAVQDELYNPELINYSESKSRQSTQNVSASKNAVYHQNVPVKNESKNSFPSIFQEAQQQHQQDFQQMHRDRSPFRHDSPYHPTNTPYGVSYGPDNSMQHSQSSVNLDQNQIAMAIALREQMRKDAENAVAPKTISPRDSLLEYNETDSHHNQMNLFPPLSHSRMGPPQEDALSNSSIHNSSQDGSEMDDFHSMATSRRASMANSSVSSHLDVPRFNYLQQQPSYENMTNNPYYYSDTSSVASSLPVHDNSSIPYIKEEMDYNPIQRPTDVSANSGTYTCTYSGCGQRFTTSTKLQKHRREAHRKAVPSGNSVSTAAAIASRNAQPGPHRCMRTNPSTGKPCNTVFSRPYDLTRHEDTIHNSAKEKVRCDICNDEKTFSRPDALVRHRRVKHGIH